MTAIFSRIRKTPAGYSIVDQGQEAYLERRLPQTFELNLLPVEGVRYLVEQAADSGLPLWLNFSAENTALVDVRVPIEAQIAEIEEFDPGLLVHLVPSQLPRVLRHEHPEYSRLASELRIAATERSWITIMESDDHEIGDISGPFVPPVIEEERRKRPFDERQSTALAFTFDPASAISMAQAVRLFNMVDSQSCLPASHPAGCIPFFYPDDGCWARAHEMCRLFGRAGVVSGKAWLYGHLFVRTANNPNCQVSWQYHVAPLVLVQQGGEHILDPSIFRQPVPLATWCSAQNDRAAQLARSDSSVYYRPQSGSPVQADPGYSDTVRNLAIYRLKLIERIAKVGAMPYAQCH